MFNDFCCLFHGVYLMYSVLGENDFCQNDTCNGHGLCVPLLDAYKCMCAHGYSGDNCTIPPDPCLINLCFEGMFFADEYRPHCHRLYS